MNITILIPTLGRARALRPLLQSIATTTPVGVANVVFVVDHDDPETHMELQEAWAQGWRFGRCFCDGTYPEKINAGYRASSDPLVLLADDDIVFHPRWLDHALAVLVDPIAVVGTNDLTPATADGQHATKPIVRRSYIESPGAAFGEPGTVLHEGYHHNFCETELCKLAQHRGVYVSCPPSIVEHRHPAWGTREADDTDLKGSQANWSADEALFEKRSAEWMDLHLGGVFPSGPK
jgi:glycosyltransferase involved in cell wall biosynthesis